MIKADTALRRFTQRSIGRLGAGLPFTGDLTEITLRNCVADAYNHDSIDTVLARRLQHKSMIIFAFASAIFAGARAPKPVANLG